MTKKYTVASSRIVRKIPGRPPGSDNSVLRLMKTITEKAMTSKSEVHVERKRFEERVMNYRRIETVTRMPVRSEETL